MTESAMRCTPPHKQAARGAPWSIALQIGGHSFTDIARQRELASNGSLSAYQQRTRVPVDVVELQSDDFTTAQTQSRQEQQDGVIAPTDRRGARTGVKHALHIVRCQVLWDIDEAPPSDCWNRRRQVARRLAGLPQKPEERAQCRRMELRTRRRAGRNLLADVARDVLDGNGLRVECTRAEPLPQKPADDKPMSGPGGRRQPSVVVQVSLVPGLQQGDRRGAARRRWRNDRFVLEKFQEERQRRCGPAMRTSALGPWPQGNWLAGSPCTLGRFLA
jgi:hypothetical protein